MTSSAIAVLLAASGAALLAPGSPRRLQMVVATSGRPPMAARDPVRRRRWTTLPRRRAEAARRAAVVELCQALAAELRAGVAPRLALHAAAHGLDGMGHLAAAAGSDHADIPALLRTMGARPGASGLLLLDACWRVAERAGGSLAGPVSRLAASLGEEEQLRREVAAQLAGARATAVLLALLPLLGIAMGTALGASPHQVLLQTPVGRVCLVVGVGLDVAGYRWIAHLTRAAEPKTT